MYIRIRIPRWKPSVPTRFAVSCRRKLPNRGGGGGGGGGGGSMGVGNTQNDFGGRVWRGLEAADERPGYVCREDGV